MFPLDQMLMDPACKDCYDKFGIHGMHYAVLFGWDGSPYKTKTDEDQRHDLVYSSVKHMDLYDTMKNKMVLAQNAKITQIVKDNVFVKKAIAVINTLARIPALEMRNYYFQQMDSLKKQADKIKYKDGADPGDVKKTADTQALFMNQIRAMEKAIDEIDKKLEAMFYQEKHVDLYDLIQNA